MIGAPQRKSMRQDRADGIQYQQSPAELDPRFSRPPAKENSERDREQRRHNGAGELQGVVGQRRKRSGDRHDEIIEWDSGVRRSSDREIFEVVSPDDRAGMFKANPGPRHSRITIGINEIDFSVEENVAVIRASRDQNERADKKDLERQPTPHAPLKSAIRISQSEFI